MAKSVINLEIDDKNVEVTIRAMKLKTIKKFSSYAAGQIDDIAELLKDGNFTANFIIFINKNIEFIADTIREFTNLTDEQFENLEYPELIKILKESMKVNSINLEAFKDFFYQEAGKPTENIVVSAALPN